MGIAKREPRDYQEMEDMSTQLWLHHQKLHEATSLSKFSPKCGQSGEAVRDMQAYINTLIRMTDMEHSEAFLLWDE